MNPTAGSFTICERAQRLFATFACLMPSKADLTTIFKSLLGGHVLGFPNAVVDSVDKIVDASLQLYDDVAKKFLPSAVRFTYNWSLRELTNIFQGICLMRSSEYNTSTDVIRLWAHEYNRVVSDRFFFTHELEIFDGLMRDVMKKQLNIPNADDLLKNNTLIFTSFADSASGAYLPVASAEHLKAVVDTKLMEYNESNAMMDLVLFEQAAEHITRISRIIAQPAGNAMLIGVGGSGKQSLARYILPDVSCKISTYFIPIDWRHLLMEWK